MNCLVRTIVMAFVLVVSFEHKSGYCQAKPLMHHISHKRLKNARIQAIKQDILSKLGLASEPDVASFNTTVEEKRRMVKLYKKSIDESQGKLHKLFSEEEYYAKKFHSFTDTGSAPPSIRPEDWVSENSQRFYFPISIPSPQDPMKETHTHTATLKLYKLRLHPDNLATDHATDMEDFGLTVRVNVFLLLEEPTRGNRPIKRLIDSTLTSLSSRGWISLNLREAVQHWVDNPEHNYGIELSCDSHNINKLITFASKNVTDFEEEDVFSAVLMDDIMPSLNVYTQDRLILGRQKRSTLEKFDCVKGGEESRCCRYPLTVNFKEIGWDWVVAPEYFQAYYCDGQCPYMFRMAHRFSGIQALIHMMNPAAAPAPCCTATELSSLNLLHYDKDGTLSVTEFTDMIVENCGCA